VKKYVLVLVSLVFQQIKLKQKFVNSVVQIEMILKTSEMSKLRLNFKRVVLLIVKINIQKQQYGVPEAFNVLFIYYFFPRDALF